MKSKNYIFIILLFLMGCERCIFSEHCYTDRNIERIRNLTNEERILEKQSCIENFQRMIDNTPNEERICTFWKCKEGKKTFRKWLKSCIWSLDNIKKENIKNLTEKEKIEKGKKECLTLFEARIEAIPNEKEYCNYFVCDPEKDNWKDMLNFCIERVSNIKNK